MQKKLNEAQDLSALAFGQRLRSAVDGYHAAPARNRGRLRWLVAQLAGGGVRISSETARRWLAGETRPRHEKLAALAEVLEVDVSWLSVGVQRDNSSDTDRRLPANPLVAIVAGLVQLEGGASALPFEADLRQGIDLHVIIDGRKLDFCLLQGDLRENIAEFPMRKGVLPSVHIIGGIYTKEDGVSFYDLSAVARDPAFDEDAPELLSFEMADATLYRAGQKIGKLRRFGPLTLI